ncbi:hypothetical protein [Rhodococcus jostii]|uniref:hypothetical protein n=1 Tax=Rhodococcus jostii TaxID=132919 RepID=UPI00115FF756|nr:hypothetical protein [Rhodococcus jostii]
MAGTLTPPTVPLVDPLSAFVADSVNNRAAALERGTSTPWDLPFPGLHVPVAVAVRGLGDRYVVDVLSNRVVVLPHASTTPTWFRFRS